jgi:hypothetical protein
MVTRTKICVALVAFSLTVAVGLLSACSVEELLHLEPSTPPVGAWPEVRLIVDPALRCPAPEASGDVYVPTIDAVIAANGRRFVRIESATGFSGERFELAFLPKAGGQFRVGVLGRKTVDYGPPFQHRLTDLEGVVTVNTLDWSEHEPIHLRCDLNYYDTESATPATMDVSGQATPTREE